MMMEWDFAVWTFWWGFLSFFVWEKAVILVNWAQARLNDKSRADEQTPFERLHVTLHTGT